MRALHIHVLYLFVCLVAAGVLSAPSNAQCAYDIIVDPDEQPFGQFGFAVALSGTTLFVGAPGNDELLPGAGAVFVFQYDGNTWIQTQRIIPDSPTMYGYFGFELDVQDDIAVVNPGRTVDEEFDSVNVYRFDGAEWVLHRTLQSPFPTKDDGFGGALKLAGDSAFLCAYDELQSNGTQGAVYIFQQEENDWQFKQKLIAPAGDHKWFGGIMAIKDDVALFTAYSASQTDPHTVFIHRFNGAQWVLEQTLTSPLEEYKQGDFGSSLLIDENIVMIGAKQEDAWKGAVHIYRYDGAQWNHVQRIVASDGVNSAYFGWRIVKHGESLLISAPYDTEAPFRGGAVYVFKHDGAEWVERSKILPPETILGGQFGMTMIRDGETAVIGTPEPSESGRIGAVMILDPFTDYDGDTIPDGCDPCPADLANTESGRTENTVDVFDLQLLLENWNTNGPGAVIAEPRSTVDVFDLLDLLKSWGPCPTP